MEETAEMNMLIGVNEPADVDCLTDLEKKHLPVIDAPQQVTRGECFEVTVEVGKLIPHPNETRHFIEFIDLYADETFLARVDLTAVMTCPKTTLCVSLDEHTHELRAYERCNLHGTWIGRKPISVEQ